MKHKELWDSLSDIDYDTGSLPPTLKNNVSDAIAGDMTDAELNAFIAELKAQPKTSACSICETGQGVCASCGFDSTIERAGRRVMAMRKHQGIKRSVLALKAGLASSTLAFYEKSKDAMPGWRYEMMLKILRQTNEELSNDTI